MEISQYRLAKETGVPAQRIGDIVAGKRAISADTEVAVGAKLAKIKPWAKVEAQESRTLTRR